MINQEDALAHLKKDPIMAELIKKVKLTNWPAPNFDNLFSDLIETVIGQQLSGKAANTIVGRFKDLFSGKFPSPQELLHMSDEKIRACGTSWAKISYVKNIAKAVVDKSLDLKDLPQMTDDEVRKELIKIKGVGNWTIEMTLMFSLRRPDIFSPGDVGLQNAINKHYKIKRGDFKKILKLSEKWQPYRTLASLYLWKSLESS
jgi:DNA-3-methyladenine glycosylase II